MPRSKSKVTVRQAAEIVFERMPREFEAIRFCRMVRSVTERFELMDGTILRRLREARNENSDQYNYRCIDTEKAIYQKITA